MERLIHTNFFLPAVVAETVCGWVMHWLSLLFYESVGTKTCPVTVYSTSTGGRQKAYTIQITEDML